MKLWLVESAVVFPSSTVTRLAGLYILTDWRLGNICWETAFVSRLQSLVFFFGSYVA